MTGDTNAKGITSRYDYNNENDRQNIAYISGLTSVNYNYFNGALGIVVRGGYIDDSTEKQNQTMETVRYLKKFLISRFLETGKYKKHLCGHY